MRPALAVPLVLLSATVSAGPAQLRHDPIACVPGDRHVTVTTRAEPAEAAVAVELQFRAEGSDWYGVAMARENGVWSARLPRATASLPRFDYRLVTTSTDADVTESEPVSVAVKADCDTAGQTALTASIIVRVPPGAPLVPPVPPGFNPAGVVAAQEHIVAGPKRGEPRWTRYAIGAAAGGAAGAALAGSGGSASEPREVDIPGFALQRVSPEAGAVLSPQTRMLVFVNMDHEPERPLTLDWRFELRDRSFEGFAPPCAAASGSLQGAKTPLGLVLTAPLMPTGTCGRSFSTSFLTLVLTIDGRPIHEEAIHVPYTFEP
jgi:hypothetical protein